MTRNLSRFPDNNDNGNEMPQHTLRHENWRMQPGERIVFSSIRIMPQFAHGVSEAHPQPVPPTPLLRPETRSSSNEEQFLFLSPPALVDQAEAVSSTTSQDNEVDTPVSASDAESSYNQRHSTSIDPGGLWITGPLPEGATTTNSSLSAGLVGKAWEGGASPLHILFPGRAIYQYQQLNLPPHPRSQDQSGAEETGGILRAAEHEKRDEQRRAS
jgi:hypothetical protein